VHGSLYEALASRTFLRRVQFEFLQRLINLMFDEYLHRSKHGSLFFLRIFLPSCAKRANWNKVPGARIAHISRRTLRIFDFRSVT
jgi:hypothetical protein